MIWILSISLALLVYTFAGYAVLLAIWSRLSARPVRARNDAVASVSIIVSALNEESIIERRLRELSDVIAHCGVAGEIILVSDGSSDRTAEKARAVAEAGLPVHVVALAENVGKAAALTIGCQSAKHQILVFADARQTWNADSLTHLIQNFSDPGIGAASGDLVLEKVPGVAGAVDFYWRYEKWIRRAESRIHSCVGVSGSIAAVRRELFTPIPAGTILDDVFWPMHVVMKGYRVVHEERAKAFDRLPERSRDEFRRKVRTLSGNFQLVTRAWPLLLPWRNAIWWQFVSHKLLRLVAPWAMLAMLVSSAMLWSLFGRIMLGAQIIFYTAALISIALGSRCKFRPLAIAGSFCMLNAAAWMAFWVWITGRTARSWKKITYSKPISPSLSPAN